MMFAWALLLTRNLANLLLRRCDPVFDPMRNDPCFTEIVKKTGLLDN